MQDNFFFREPSTQRKLLDILFVYSKLHPDTGYRQGMHELLAPILWAVERDALFEGPGLNRYETGSAHQEVDLLMLNALDGRYIEHDAFALFCAVMQTAKVAYELGESTSTSPIVDRSRRIHEDLLSNIDEELADHLQAIEVLPQVFLMYGANSLVPSSSANMYKPLD